jgi:hypothetical protein
VVSQPPAHVQRGLDFVGKSRRLRTLVRSMTRVTLEAKDMDEAYAVAARFPPARIGTIEVRRSKSSRTPGRTTEASGPDVRRRKGGSARALACTFAQARSSFVRARQLRDGYAKIREPGGRKCYTVRGLTNARHCREDAYGPCRV